MPTARSPAAYHAGMGVRERGDQFRRLVRSAVADLFDQRSPFGRLALTHVLMTAGDTMFAVSLAGSLFFSISPTAAKDKVLLYLLLTMGPFAVVAPALGPLIDRSRGARRAMVVASALGRAAAVPVRGAGHPLPAAVPRGLRDAGAVEGLSGHQGGAGPRDGGPRACSAPAGGTGPAGRRTLGPRTPRAGGRRAATPPYGDAPDGATSTTPVTGGADWSSPTWPP